jgi:hypothetical protein
VVGLLEVDLLLSFGLIQIPKHFAKQLRPELLFCGGFVGAGSGAPDGTEPGYCADDCGPLYVMSEDGIEDCFTSAPASAAWTYLR